MWVTHVSGDSLCIENPPGRVLKPGDVKQIEGAGMPTKGFLSWLFWAKKKKKKWPIRLILTIPDDANIHGDLFVEFEIIFPDTLDQTQRDSLAALFGKNQHLEPSFHENGKDGE